MSVERRFLPTATAGVKVVTRDDGKRVLVGYASVFYREGDAATEYELWDDVKERIAPGSFNRALNERHDARALFNHDPDNLLGRVGAGTVRLSVDDVGLRYEIPFDEQDPDHQRVMRKIERGDLTGSSFAFVPTRQSWIESGDQIIRLVEDVVLYDVGPVTYPAYAGTTATATARDQAGATQTGSARAGYDAFVSQRDAAHVEVKNRLYQVDAHSFDLAD